MKKEIILLFIFVIAASLICGCVTQSQSSQSVVRTARPTPVPTPQNQFVINEPASDGNLKITLLEFHDGDRIDTNIKRFLITVKLENLRTDKKIQILRGDFRLISSNYKFYPSLHFYDHDTISLAPGESITALLGDDIPQNVKNLRLQFDFSGPNGTGEGGPIVYFNLY